MGRLIRKAQILCVLLAVLAAASSAQISTSPHWAHEGDVTKARFGSKVAGAGDIDNDGFEDAVIGVPGYDEETGIAIVYYGANAGLSNRTDTLRGTQTGMRFGASVAGAGDVNGDGFADIVVGAPAGDNDDTDEGLVFVYHGGAEGVNTLHAWVGQSNQDSAGYGVCVAGAGDVNGDGYEDIIIGSSLEDASTLVDCGVACIYYGSPEGIMGLAGQRGAPGTWWYLHGENAGDWFGHGVAGIGDVNGDGYDDVMIGAPRFTNGDGEEGRAVVYLGSDSGIGDAEAWSMESNSGVAYYGACVAGAGDVNGDGYADALVGALYFSTSLDREGKAFLYLGSSTGLGATACWSAIGTQDWENYGYAVAGAGDVNGDGYDDVLVGSCSFDSLDLYDAGKALLYFGSPTGISAIPDWTGSIDSPHAHYGYSVAGRCDVNGDGVSDFIIGANAYTNGESEEGGVWAFHGHGPPPAPIPILPDDHDTIMYDPVFTWGLVAPAVTYDLQVWADSDQPQSFSLDAKNLTDTLFTMSAGLMDTTYRWRVRSQNDAAPSGWSDVRSFTVRQTAFRPVLVAPAAGDTVHADSVTLVWRSVAGATKYRVELRRIGTNTASLFTETVDSSVVVWSLEDNASYTWRVQACRLDDTCGLYCAPRTFVVMLPTGVWARGISTVPSYAVAWRDSRLCYMIPEAQDIGIEVYTARGRRVLALRERAREAGTHAVSAQQLSLPPGFYMVVFRAGGITRQLAATVAK